MKYLLIIVLSTLIFWIGKNISDTFILGWFLGGLIAVFTYWANED